jgi:hypothetical protein
MEANDHSICVKVVAGASRRDVVVEQRQTRSALKELAVVAVAR